MKSKDYHKEIERSYKKLDRLLPLIAKDFDANHIHDIRLEIKKLKALYRFIKTAGHKGKSPDIPPPLKKIYRLLGEIRNLQLHLDQLASIEEGKTLSPGYRNFLQDRLQKEKNLASEQLSSPLLPESLNNRNDGTRQEFSHHHIRKYYSKKRAKIFQAINGDRSFQNIHQLRKNLKDLQYNKVALQHGIKHFQYQKIQSMARLIGKYIDSWNSLHYITRYGHMLSASDQDKTRVLHDALSHEKSKMLRAFKKSLPAFKKSLAENP